MKIKNKIKEDGLRRFFEEKNLLGPFVSFIIRSSSVESSENLYALDFHGTKGGTGLYGRMGGDWENPCEFLIFIDSDLAVWVQTLNVLNSPSESVSEQTIERKIEMISKSPIEMKCECVGQIEK